MQQKVHLSGIPALPGLPLLMMMVGIFFLNAEILFTAM